MVRIYNNEAVVFDLDDLLYKEFEFMRSAFWEIAQTVAHKDAKKLLRMMLAQYFSGNAVLTWLQQVYLKNNSEYSLDFLITLYRNHKPSISLNAQTRDLLDTLKRNGNRIGVLTDGRSITQRNKIDALGLEQWADMISISEECGNEKPSEKPFMTFQRMFDCQKFVYVADNYAKDFIAPKKLGWRTIAVLDNGLNIHSKAPYIECEYMADEKINDLSEIVVMPFPDNKEIE